MRPLRLLLRFAPLVLILVGVVTDWPTGWLQPFWVDHAFVTAATCTALFVWLGLSVLDWWNERTVARRLRRIIRTAYRACARIPLEQRRALWLLVAGGAFIGDEDFSINPAEAARVAAVFKRLKLIAISEGQVISHAVSAPNLVTRLGSLTKDPDWRDVSYDVLRATVHNSRTVVARWAPVMLSTPESAAVHLDIVNDLDRLEQLYARFQPTRVGGRPSQAGAADVDAFVACLERSVALHERLVNSVRSVTGEEAYSSGRLLVGK